MKLESIGELRAGQSKNEALLWRAQAEAEQKPQKQLTPEERVSVHAEIVGLDGKIAHAEANIERILAEMKNGRDTAREAGLPESSIQHAEAAITVEKMEFVNKKKVLEAQKKALEDKLVV